MTEYKNKVGKIVEQDKSSITIEGTDGKKHTFAKENGGKIHGMLEGTGNQDAGEWNSSKTGFLIFWKTTKKAEPSPVKSISNEPAPKAETDKKAQAYGFAVSPGVVDVGVDAVAQAQARIDAKNAAPAKEPAQTPCKCQQNDDAEIAGAVGLKVHINLGSFCNFDLSVEGQSGEHARQLLKQEAEKSIPLVANIMREAMKVSQQVKY